MRNHKVLLIVAIFWMLCTILSSNILARVTDMALAVSTFANYMELQFRPNAAQKDGLNRTKIFSLVIAGIFLVLQIYYLFIA